MSWETTDLQLTVAKRSLKIEKKLHRSSHQFYENNFGLGFRCEEHDDGDGSQVVKKVSPGRDWGGKGDLHFNW